MTGLKWKRDPILDTEESIGKRGHYECIRTVFDTSVLLLDGREIYRFISGSHAASMAFANCYDDNNEPKTEANKSRALKPKTSLPCPM